jgi:hypothetical protein
LKTLTRSLSKKSFSSSGVSSFHSLPVTAIFLSFHLKHFIHSLISSGPFLRLHAHLPSKHYFSFCSLPVLISFVLSFRIIIIPSQQLAFFSNSCLVVISCFLQFIYSLFIDVVFSTPGSFFVVPAHFALCELSNLTSNFVQIKILDREHKVSSGERNPIQIQNLRKQGT